MVLFSYFYLLPIHFEDFIKSVLSSIFFADMSSMMMYPLAIAGVCTLASIVGTYFVFFSMDLSIDVLIKLWFKIGKIIFVI